MEAKEETTLPAVGGMEVKYRKVFSIPDEELKAFYLKEAVMLRPNYSTPNCSELHLLCILKDEYKKIITFLSQLNSYHWELDIPNLHEVFLPYSFQSTIPIKRRKAVCDAMSEHIRFLSHVSGNQVISRELCRYYQQSYNNLERIISLYYTDEVTNPLEQSNGDMD